MVQSYNPKRGRYQSDISSRKRRRRNREMQLIPNPRIPLEEVKDVIITDINNPHTTTHIEADSMTSCSTLSKNQAKSIYYQSFVSGYCS